MLNNEKNGFLARTDLALEESESLNKEERDSSGIITKISRLENIKITEVKITNKKASETVGKPVGRYVTVESAQMKLKDSESHEKIVDVFSKIVRKLSKIKPEDTVLVIGLGNWNITPDALGPKVVGKMLVTRNMEEFLGKNEGEICSVAALSPGVMGITGIETAEIVKSLVKSVKPDLVIAVDALAARRLSRINAAIQITDTGICPGSGVGNRREALDEKSLGVPVIAVGVPTVVDGATLVNDSMDRILEDVSERCDKKHKLFFETLMSLKNEEKYALIKELLEPYEENMFVTPKSVDADINRISTIIAKGLNIALHPELKKDDISRLSEIN